MLDLSLGGALCNNLWQFTCLLAICEGIGMRIQKWDLPIRLSYQKLVDDLFKLINAAGLWNSLWRTQIGFSRWWSDSSKPYVEQIVCFWKGQVSKSSEVVQHFDIISKKQHASFVPLHDFFFSLLICNLCVEKWLLTHYPSLPTCIIGSAAPLVKC